MSSEPINPPATNGKAMPAADHESRSMVLAPENALARGRYEPRSFTELMVVAKVLAASNLVPKGTPAESVAAIVAMGAEMGLGMMAAIKAINIINGKPGLYADAAHALINKSGLSKYFQPVGELTATRAEWTTWRKDWEQPRNKVFTIENAIQGELHDPRQNKGMYAKWPREMLSARCKLSLAREVYPEICGGMYEPQAELGEVTEIDVTPERSERSTKRRQTREEESQAELVQPEESARYKPPAQTKVPEEGPTRDGFKTLFKELYALVKDRELATTKWKAAVGEIEKETDPTKLSAAYAKAEALVESFRAKPAQAAKSAEPETKPAAATEQAAEKAAPAPESKPAASAGSSEPSTVGERARLWAAVKEQEKIGMLSTADVLDHAMSQWGATDAKAYTKGQVEALITWTGNASARAVVDEARKAAGGAK